MRYCTSLRTLRRFELAAAKTGGTIISAAWEPLRCVDFGADGGWLVKVSWPHLTRHCCVGTNVEDAIRDIEWVGNDYLKRQADRLESRGHT